MAPTHLALRESPRDAAPRAAPRRPRCILDVAPRAGLYQVIRCHRGPADATTHVATLARALGLVLGEALATARDLMDRQKRTLSDLQVHEYSFYVVKAYAAPDANGDLAYLGQFCLGDVAAHMRERGLNFDEVLDDPSLLAACVREWP